MNDRKMGTCEIVESLEELEKNGKNSRKHFTLKRGQKGHEQFFVAIEIRKSIRGMSPQESKDRYQKSAMKKPNNRFIHLFVGVVGRN